MAERCEPVLLQLMSEVNHLFLAGRLYEVGDRA